MNTISWLPILPVGLSIFLLGCSASPDLATSNPASPPPAETAVSAPSPATDLSQMPMGQQLPIEAQAEIGDGMIQLEVARTPQQQATGLMYREALADDRGMLFTFDPPRPVQFWMRNVVIDLDMVFMRDGKVTAIAANVPPCRTTPCPTYGPDVAIDQVIELRGGRAAELNVQVGDIISINYLTP